jgi:hypothetical protein
MNDVMRTASQLGAIALLVSGVVLGAEGITDNASAISAAKRYLKARCTTETPCRFKPEKEGNQWRVWVQTTRRSAANQAPRPYPGGTLILYFDTKGNLMRRLEAD